MMPHHAFCLMLVLVAVCLLPDTLGQSSNATLSTLQNDVQGLKNKVTTLEKFHEPGIDNVSFLARLSSRIMPLMHSVIKFPMVIENIGNGYNATTGKFTAPVSGTYLFHVSAVAKVVIQVDILRDGDLLATAWGYNRWGDVQGSNTAAVHMRQGQRVWPRFMQGYLPIVGWGYTQFTGSLLQKD